MKLEFDSLEDGSTLRSRVRLAIVALEHEREVARWRLQREAEHLGMMIIRAHEQVTNLTTSGQKAHIAWGSFGAQIAPDKVNGLAGMLVAYDEAIELLRDVLNPSGSA